MKTNPTAIPQGTRTYLFDAAANKRYLEQTLHSVMRSRGFQEIVTPPVEYYESMITGLDEEERNRIIRFTEGDSGKMVALRSDITLQVARSAATHLSKRPFPLKLCYTGDVFRRARKGKGEQYVLHQSGMEIIGHSGPEADVDVIRTITAELAAVGISGYSLSLGHAGIVANLLRTIDEPLMEKIKKALGKKDKTTLDSLLEEGSVAAGDAKKISALTELYGGKEVLDKAEEIYDDAHSKKALENLKGIFKGVEEAKPEGTLSIDLGEMRGFGYYTGITMELFSSSGNSLGTGGRYDNLVKRFGPDIPAVGFAFDIDKMIETLEKNSTTPEWRASDVLLVGGDYDTAETLRKSGLMVTAPLEDMAEKDAKSYAEKMNIPNILIKTSKEKYNWTGISSGKKQNVAVQEFINNYFK